jgi:hypothetical protein
MFGNVSFCKETDEAHSSCEIHILKASKSGRPGIQAKRRSNCNKLKLFHIHALSHWIGRTPNVLSLDWH